MAKGVVSGEGKGLPPFFALEMPSFERIRYASAPLRVAGLLADSLTKNIFLNF